MRVLTSMLIVFCLITLVVSGIGWGLSLILPLDFFGGAILACLVVSMTFSVFKTASNPLAHLLDEMEDLPPRYEVKLKASRRKRRRAAG